VRFVVTLPLLIALGEYADPQFAAAQAIPPNQAAPDNLTVHETRSGTLDPDPASELHRPRPLLSPAEWEALAERHEEARETTSAPYNVDTSKAADSSWPIAVSESTVDETIDDEPLLFQGKPEEFIIGRNALNSQANNEGNSPLAEPAAANEGINIFYAGNYAHNEYSSDGGKNWTDVPVPGGPVDAPVPSFDWDVIYDQARGVTFRSGLYLNDTASNGVVRIFVRREIESDDNCIYTIDPAGESDNTLPDFPHINISNNFLYLTTNNFGGVAGNRAQVRRFSLDEMARCRTASFSLYEYLWDVGQRVFVPAEGAREDMYWVMHEDVDTLRVFHWAEDSPSPVSLLRDVGATAFGVDEDCTGGTGNYDWWGLLSGTILGFYHRTAVGHGRIHTYWNATSDASHTQGHIHGAIFEERAVGTGHVVGDLVAEPVIFNNGACFGNPVISANERGDVGMVLGVGGNAGPGGLSARPAVGIDDDFTKGLGIFAASGGATFAVIAAGTHNRPDNRYGDYFTIHPQEPCDNFFNATGYAMNGGVDVGNVNARYVEFGRARDYGCYRRWADEDPVCDR